MSKRIHEGYVVILLLLGLLAVCCDKRELPDLTVDSITLTPTKPAPGERILLKAVIKNKGAATAPASEAAIRFGKEIYPQKFNIPTLEQEAIYYIERYHTSGTAQNIRVTVYADYTGMVTECDETNNKKYKCFKID